MPKVESSEYLEIKLLFLFFLRRALALSLFVNRRFRWRELQWECVDVAKDTGFTSLLRTDRWYGALRISVASLNGGNSCQQNISVAVSTVHIGGKG